MLTDHQVNCILMKSRGLSNDVIADKLGITARGVQETLARARRKIVPAACRKNPGLAGQLLNGQGQIKPAKTIALTTLAIWLGWIDVDTVWSEHDVTQPTIRRAG